MRLMDNGTSGACCSWVFLYHESHAGKYGITGCHEESRVECHLCAKSGAEMERFMSLPSLFIIAVGLSMDAFAVSICKGLAMQKINLKKAVIVGLWFGSFQALMPILGYLLGVQFQQYITAIDHWVAFILLSIIGISMIREALSKDDECSNASLDIKTMFVLAVATSIDALAVGVTFAFLQVNIVPAVCFIGIITFLLSAIGVKVGNVFGTQYKAKAELAGGIILILMGIKILLEHLGFLG